MTPILEFIHLREKLHAERLELARLREEMSRLQSLSREVNRDQFNWTRAIIAESRELLRTCKVPPEAGEIGT